MKARSLSAAIASFAVVLAACTGGASPSPAASAASEAPASAPAASSPSATAAPSLTGSEYGTIKPLKPAFRNAAGHKEGVGRIAHRHI